MDTTITNQEVKVRLNNDFYSTISPSAVSFIDTIGTGFNSSLNATTLQITESSGNLDANLTNSALTFYNGNTGNTYTLGVNTNDFVMDAGGDRLLLNANTNEFYIGEYFTGSAPVINSTGSTGKTLYVNSRNEGKTFIGDTDNAGNETKISVNDLDQEIYLTNNSGISVIEVGAGDIRLDSFGNVTIGDYNIAGNGQYIFVDNNNSNIKLNANNGIAITKSTLQYSSTYNTTSQSLGTASNYAQTFNGSSLTATLPSVSALNVGIQFLITNTNASSMSVVSTGGQIIYSIIGGATSITLAVGHSHIFTAILTTGASTYGWSMV